MKLRLIWRHCQDSLLIIGKLTLKSITIELIVPPTDPHSIEAHQTQVSKATSQYLVYHHASLKFISEMTLTLHAISTKWIILTVYQQLLISQYRIYHRHYQDDQLFLIHRRHSTHVLPQLNLDGQCQELIIQHIGDIHVRLRLNKKIIIM